MADSALNGREPDFIDEKEELGSGVRVSEWEMAVPWGVVRGRWWGPRDLQPVVAMHGWQDNAGTWDRLAPRLPVSLAMLAIDLPGHGRSDPIPTGQLYYIFWDGVPLLRRIIKANGWTRVTLLGHSLGGALAFLYAASFPDEVEAIACVDIASPAVRAPADMAANTGRSVDKLLEYERLRPTDAPSYTREELVDVLHDAHRGSLSRADCVVMLRRGAAPATDQPGRWRFTRDPRLKVSGLAMMSLETALEYAARVRCRVLNVRARPGQRWERDDYYTAVLDVLRVRAQLEYHEVPGTHHVHLNDPDRMLDILIDFLLE